MHRQAEPPFNFTSPLLLHFHWVSPANSCQALAWRPTADGGRAIEFRLGARAGKHQVKNDQPGTYGHGSRQVESKVPSADWDYPSPSPSAHTSMFHCPEGPNAHDTDRGTPDTGRLAHAPLVGRWGPSAHGYRSFVYAHETAAPA
ncbi:hypothetical protein BCR44DRAFT_234281 [Catenaria anguillulae PL171]|uniref:Uncharacterized protein n=1 Tax=Catenaria anguillulae PL171 TaxID=765915 RepID=A0A1Y2HMX6_9FUNG|nr:hypothetical protein BCR44DRAFT_234281 [Catenaria anguillulae PL171]